MTTGDHARHEDEEGSSEGAGGREDISETTAPSIGPNTTIEREDPDERLARHEQSDVDAMGLDKRRDVVGGSYGPSTGKQLRLYGGVLVAIVALVVGFIILVGQLDGSEEDYADLAPWANPDAQQTPVKDLE